MRSFVKTSIKRHDKSLTALKEGQSQLDKNMAELRQEVTEHSNQVQNSIESLKTFITQQFSAQNPPVMANLNATTNAVSPLGERWGPHQPRHYMAKNPEALTRLQQIKEATAAFWDAMRENPKQFEGDNMISTSRLGKN